MKRWPDSRSAAAQCSTLTLTGPVGTDFGTSICGERPQTHVPSTAASGIAQPCRLDGCSHTCRLRAPIQVRCKTRKANEHSRYMRVMRLVNQRRLSRQTDEVDQKSCALRLLAATHRGLTSGEHLLELEPALRPALTFTCSPRRRIRAFGRYAGKVWLHKLGGLLQLGQLVCAMRVVGGQRVMSVRSSGERGDEPGARSCDAAACRLSWRLAAHPAAARIRAIRNRSARLEAFQLPTQRARQGSVECA